MNAKTQKDQKGQQQEFRGVPMTNWIRLCGMKGFNREKTEMVLKQMHLHPQKTTLSTQLYWGRARVKKVDPIGFEAKKAFEVIVSGVVIERGQKAIEKRKELKGKQAK